MGVNPAHVFKGSQTGLRILGAEEDMARTLLTSFDAKGITRVVVDSEAPADIITRWEPRVKPEEPVGLPLQEMTEDQGQSLMDLVSLYVSRVPDEVADIQMNRIEKAGRGYIHFAWAGSAVAGEPHYYRVHGPSFLVEYDNTQNNANHIHTVWRDFTNDWGDDLLQSHYVDSHTQS